MLLQHYDRSLINKNVIHMLQVDEPPRELSPEWQETTTSREVERGFSGKSNISYGVDIEIMKMDEN